MKGNFKIYEWHIVGKALFKLNYFISVCFYKALSSILGRFFFQLVTELQIWLQVFEFSLKKYMKIMLVKTLSSNDL